MCDREEPVHCFTPESVIEATNLPACDVRHYPVKFSENLKTDSPVVEMVKEAVETDIRTEELAARLNAEPQKQLTEQQFRKLRGLYFTVRHHRVQPCGHLLDQINEPTFRNCEACWFCFFNSHGQLVEVTDKAFQEQGRDFLVKMRGEKYAKMFTRFMSTVARMKKESDERAREAESSNDQAGEVQGSSGSGESVRQEVGHEDIPTAG